MFYDEQLLQIKAKLIPTHKRLENFNRNSDRKRNYKYCRSRNFRSGFKFGRNRNRTEFWSITNCLKQREQNLMSYMTCIDIINRNATHLRPLSQIITFFVITLIDLYYTRRLYKLYVFNSKCLFKQWKLHFIYGICLIKNCDFFEKNLINFQWQHIRHNKS